jgi:DNA invertase Pin-like site-specific DNA recombinase
MDRLARSTQHLLEIVQGLEKKDVALRILDFKGDKVDTHSPQGRPILNMFAAFAQFERELMLERQRDGIAKAKAEGRYKGRKPTAMAKADEVKALVAEGVGPSEIARRLGIGRTSVHRIRVGASSTREKKRKDPARALSSPWKAKRRVLASDRGT